MQFLYPFVKQYPFDGVCEVIVKALEERNWQVPGIEVKFDVYGSGEQKFTMVREIKGPDFRLYFSRVQRTMPGSRWNDTAAVNTIVIPKKEIHVYEDESGPTLYLYVGNDWERDRQKFMYGCKVNSKLNREPRMYLEYKGACTCRATGGASFSATGLLGAWVARDAEALSQLTHTHDRRRSPLLVHTNDLGREYDPKPRGKWNWKTWSRDAGEPTMFQTADIMAEFERYLENVVLKMIVSSPIPSEKIDPLAPAPVIPVPESIGPLFCFAEYREADRIKQGKDDINTLALADRSVTFGSMTRLLSLDVPNDGTVPEIAYDGFNWCGVGEVTSDTPIESLEVPGHYRWSDRERFVVRVRPNRANDVYIADHAPYEKRRREIAGTFVLDGRDRFTDAEVADFRRAGARTIIPITEYKGGFEQPVVLISRELTFDEVEVVSGPHKDRHDR